MLQQLVRRLVDKKRSLLWRRQHGQVVVVEQALLVVALLSRAAVTCRRRVHAAAGEVVVDMDAYGGGVRTKAPRRAAADVVAWTAHVGACVARGRGEEAWAAYSDMLAAGCSPNGHTVVAAARALVLLLPQVGGGAGAAAAVVLHRGRAVHALARSKGLDSEDGFVASALVTLYGRCGTGGVGVSGGGLWAAARHVFDAVARPDVVVWNAMLAVYARGSGSVVSECMQLYADMVVGGAVAPDAHTLVILVQACGSAAHKQQQQRQYEQGEGEDHSSSSGSRKKWTFLGTGKALHAECARLALLPPWGCGRNNGVVANAVMSMYARCGSPGDATLVFRALDRPDAVAWTAMLAALARELPDQAVRLYADMLEESGGSPPDAWAAVHALQACALLAHQQEHADSSELHLRPLQMVKAIHAATTTAATTSSSSNHLGSALVCAYGKCGSLADALALFRALPPQQRDVVAWTAVLAAHVEYGRAREALELYHEMLLLLVEQEAADGGQGGAAAAPNSRTLVAVAQACGALGQAAAEAGGCAWKWLAVGKAVHAEAVRRGWEGDAFVGSSLVAMYGKCGSAADAQAVFDRLVEQQQQQGVPVGVWNALMAAYVEQERPRRAWELYLRLLGAEGEPGDARTVTTALRACGMLAAAAAAEEEAEASSTSTSKYSHHQAAKAIHAHAHRQGYLAHDPLVGTTLISVYSKCGSIHDARHAFLSALPHPGAAVAPWNAMLAACADHGLPDEALRLYAQMQEHDECGGGVSPDARTFVSVLQACTALAATSSSITKQRPGWCWWSLEDDNDEQQQQQQERCKALQSGKAAHAELARRGYAMDPFVGSAMVAMYGKCGSLADATLVFRGLPDHDDAVAWTAMVQAYVEHGQPAAALDLYCTSRRHQEIEKEEEAWSGDEDAVALLCVVQACGDTGSLALLRELHGTLIAGKEVVALDPFLASSLVHAYGKCSSMADAQAVFDTAAEPRDVVLWNALIAGYARDGSAATCLRLFDEMQRGTSPNLVTFLSLIAACSHAGWVREGVQVFEAMVREHGIAPEPEHCASLVDLLGRAGCFGNVEGLVAALTMPTTTPAAAAAADQEQLPVWLALLSACRKHGELGLGKRAFDRAVRVQPRHAAAYKILSSMCGAVGDEGAEGGDGYSAAGTANEEEEVGVEPQAGRGTWKQPGQSWVEHECQVHWFMVGDHRQDPQEDMQLYALVEHVSMELVNSGLGVQ